MRADTTPPMTITVLVPSHRRPQDLRRCLNAVGPQLADGDQLMVVYRVGDYETMLEAQKAWHDTHLVPVIEPGVWPAYAAGIGAAQSEAVAFLDDDAIPMDGWLDALRHRLTQDPSIGAIGGPILNFRDIRTSNAFFEGGFVTEVTTLAQLRTRLHEIPARSRVEEVDFLPGSNMAVRSGLIDLDRYPMIGMAPAIEWRMALAVRRQGHRVVYDSDIRVEHHPSPRELSRCDRERVARDLGYAMTAIVGAEYPAGRRLRPLAWWVLAGTRQSPGLLLGAAAALRGPSSFRKWCAAMHGRILGTACARRARDEA